MLFLQVHFEQLGRRFIKNRNSRYYDIAQRYKYQLTLPKKLTQTGDDISENYSHIFYSKGEWEGERVITRAWAVGNQAQIGYRVSQIVGGGCNAQSSTVNYTWLIFGFFPFSLNTTIKSGFDPAEEQRNYTTFKFHLVFSYVL